MAQIIMHQWEDGLGSFDHRRQYTGILMPGRYSGFDSFTPAGLNFVIDHTVGGVLETDVTGVAVANRKGVAITIQGLFIHETAALASMACVSNAANGTIRTDLVLCEHLYLDATPGGAPAVYSVLQGPFGSSSPSAIPNPEKQFIIGRISIPANAATLASATYTPEPVKFLGGNDLVANFLLDARYARLAAVNTFTKTQIYGEVTLAAGDFSGGKLTFKDGGNSQSYPPAAIAQTVNEIEEPAAGVVYTRYILRNQSSNAILLNFGQTPSAGGWPIYFQSSGLSGLSIPNGAWVELAYINGVWWVLNTSLFVGYVMASKVITDQISTPQTTTAVVAGDITALSNGPVVSVTAGSHIHHRRVGNILEMWFTINITGTVAASTDINATVDITPIVTGYGYTGLGVPGYNNFMPCHAGAGGGSGSLLTANLYVTGSSASFSLRTGDWDDPGNTSMLWTGHVRIPMY